MVELPVEASYLNPAPIIALPLLGAVVLLLFGKRIGRLAGHLASGTMAISFALSLFTFGQMIGTDPESRSETFHLFDWIASGRFAAGIDLTVDQLSILMLLVVTGVGTLIHVYSIGYMEGDERYHRFFAYLNLFAASMLLLVLAENVLLLYVGWEGVGLCSYLLIGFWFERPAASNAAKKAFIVNRIGDFAFLLGILLLFHVVGSLSIGEINEAAGGGHGASSAILGPDEPLLTAGIATIAALLLFAGATGKSAQVPLYVWLPDAMEGPTPVSALIHAATMVTAGVYMVIRMSPVFEASGGAALAVVGWIGAITALLAALMAATEYDIKRVLAYSTISQLGYMFLANGVHAYSAGMFHLLPHAFFKALMFLGAGAVMHALAGETDMRKMGGLRKVMPVTGLTFLAGWLAISGVFPLAGFWSKDAILASAWAEGQYALWAIGIATAALTAFYMSRLYFRVFEGRLKVPVGVHVHDAPTTMAAALLPLGVLSVIGGAINLPGLLTLEHFLEPVVGESHVPSGLTPWVLAGGALLVAAVGIAFAHSLYRTRAGGVRRRVVKRRYWWLIKPARDKFYVDRAYGALIVLPGKRFAQFCASILDSRGVDAVVNGTGRMVAGLAEGMRKIQTGYVRSYAATFFLGVVVVFSVLVVRVAAS
jgi:NADH-quinone oxidoreductase subunit L